MSFKKVAATALAIFLVAVFASTAQTYTIRFNTVASPSDIQVEAMNKFAEVATTMSGGKLQVKIFHSGQLGDQKTALLGVQKGSLEMACDASPAWLADIAAYPEIGVLEVAYLFRDIDHMYRVLKGPVGQSYWDTLAKKSGIRVLDVWYLGTRELHLTKKAGPAKTPTELKPMKVRWPNSEAWLDVGRALGATPTPMGFGEVYLALKTGTIDGQDNPIPTSYAEKFMEVTKYLVLTDHMLGYVTPVINEKLWAEMPETYRVYIRKAMDVARFYMNSRVSEEEATLLGKAIVEYGTEVIVPDKKAFMDFAKAYYAGEKFTKRWGAGAYARIQGIE